MEITIKNLEFIERSIKASDIFEPKTLHRMYQAIMYDFQCSVEEVWSEYETKEALGYDWETTVGGLKLQKQALEKAIEASEMNLYDFRQHYADVIDEDYDEYEKFVRDVREGKYNLVAGSGVT